MSQYKNSSLQPSPHSRPVPSIPSTPHLQALAGVALILVAVVLAYLPALRGDFLIDDDGLLTENPLIKTPDGLYRFWCSTRSQDYWPVTNTTLWLEWRLWGMNSTGYHLTNLILHMAASLLMWAILRKLSIPGAFLATLLFAVHPVNVESVAWISQRKNMLAMLFFLLSILWYLLAERASCLAPEGLYCPGKGRWYWLSFSAFLLAMLSKGSVAMLPILLLGIIWWRRPLTKWDLARIAPFFLMAVVLTGVNFWFQTHGSGKVIRSASLAERLLGAGGVVWFYLYKALLPLNLVFVYPQWNIQAGNLLWWLPLAAAMILSGVLWQYRRGWSRPLLFAWGFFCVSLLPVLGFTDVGFMKYSLVSDHYQHLALLGVMTLVAAGWCGWRERLRGRAHLAADVAAVVAVAILTFLACQQSRLYRNAITLYQATLQKNPDCWIAHYNLGVIQVNVGLIAEAIKHYEQTLRLKPDYYQAHYNLACALISTDRPLEALEHYEQALRLKPYSAEARNNLANTLIKLGRPLEAIKHFAQNVRLHPDSAEFHNNLATAFVEIGQHPQAIEYYERALRLNPDYAEAYAGLAETYAKTNRTSEAIAAAQKALELARSKGQTTLAKQLEDWLKSYPPQNTVK